MVNEDIKLKYGITKWPEYQLNYWNIPKVLSTAVKAALLKQDIKNQYDINSELHDISVKEFITREEAENNGYLNFTVIRDPYERIISMYKDFGLRRPLKKVQNEHLVDFDRFLENIILNTNDDETSNPHFRSISYYIMPKDKILVDRVLTKKTIQEFLLKYGCTLQKVNVTPLLDINLTEIQKEKIKNKFQKDFEIWKRYSKN